MNKHTFFFADIKSLCSIACPITDFWRTRRNLLKILALPIFASVFVFFLNVSFDGLGFSGFLNTQINIIAILISFSVASVTILVSSNSEVVRVLRTTKTKDALRYRTLNGKTLSLFQILLSNITYNISIEVLYLSILIIENLYLIESCCMRKYIMILNIFCITHILSVLMTTVTQLYFTFWRDIVPDKNKKDSAQ